VKASDESNQFVMNTNLQKGGDSLISIFLVIPAAVITSLFMVTALILVLVIKTTKIVWNSRK